MRTQLILLLTIAASASAQEPPRVRVAIVGETRVEGVEEECYDGNHCDWAARASLRITTGNAPARIRVVRLEAARDYFHPVWERRPVTQLQLDVAPAIAGSTITIPAGGVHTLGVLYARENFGSGMNYRITLEIDGRRAVVHAHDHLIVEEPWEP